MTTVDLSVNPLVHRRSVPVFQNGVHSLLGNLVAV